MRQGIYAGPSLSWSFHAFPIAIQLWNMSTLDGKGGGVSYRGPVRIPEARRPTMRPLGYHKRTEGTWGGIKKASKTGAGLLYVIQLRHAVKITFRSRTCILTWKTKGTRVVLRCPRGQMLLLHTFLMWALAHTSCRSLTPATWFYNEIASSMTSRVRQACRQRLFVSLKWLHWGGAFDEPFQNNVYRRMSKHLFIKKMAKDNILYTLKQRVLSFQSCESVVTSLRAKWLMLDYRYVFFVVVVWNFKYGTSKYRPPVVFTIPNK